MNTAIRIAIAVIPCLLFASNAHATITALYDPTSGNIKLTNLETGPYRIVSFTSQEGKLVQPTAPAPYGIYADYTLLPNEVGWFLGTTFFPGEYDMGEVVSPGTPFSDLALRWFSNSSSNPIVWYPGVIKVVPEPSTLLVATLSFMAVGLVTKRRYPQSL